MTTQQIERLCQAHEFIQSFAQLCKANGLKGADYSANIQEDCIHATVFQLESGVFTERYLFDFMNCTRDTFRNWCDARLEVAKKVGTQRERRIAELKEELNRLMA